MVPDKANNNFCPIELQKKPAILFHYTYSYSFVQGLALKDNPPSLKTLFNTKPHSETPLQKRDESSLQLRPLIDSFAPSLKRLQL